VKGREFTFTLNCHLGKIQLTLSQDGWSVPCVSIQLTLSQDAQPQIREGSMNIHTMYRLYMYGIECC
jgi:hypothetical protein